MGVQQVNLCVVPVFCDQPPPPLLLLRPPLVGSLLDSLVTSSSAVCAAVPSLALGNSRDLSVCVSVSSL